MKELKECKFDINENRLTDFNNNQAIGFDQIQFKEKEKDLNCDQQEIFNAQILLENTTTILSNTYTYQALIDTLWKFNIYTSK